MRYTTAAAAAHQSNAYAQERSISASHTAANGSPLSALLCLSLTSPLSHAAADDVTVTSASASVADGMSLGAHPARRSAVNGSLPSISSSIPRTSPLRNGAADDVTVTAPALVAVDMSLSQCLSEPLLQPVAVSAVAMAAAATADSPTASVLGSAHALSRAHSPLPPTTRALARVAAAVPRSAQPTTMTSVSNSAPARVAGAAARTAPGTRAAARTALRL